jgi:hypothetical protein
VVEGSGSCFSDEQRWGAADGEVQTGAGGQPFFCSVLVRLLHIRLGPHHFFTQPISVVIRSYSFPNGQLLMY